jgi:NADH dehydrogenase [ubiquinone] 1 alpha subcomplex assembly factor 6
MIKRPTVRRSAFALRALNVELAQVLDVTSNPMTASGRFAFWSDVVEQMFAPEKSSRFDGHPIARELRSVSIKCTCSPDPCS